VFQHASQLVAVSCIMAVVIACGDDGGAIGDDRAQIEQVLDGVQADFVSGDSDAYCAKLTARARAQVAEYGRLSERGRTCEETIRKGSQLTRDAGIVQRLTKLLSVRVHGDRAVAKVSNGGRPPEPMRFVRRGGDWKIPDTGYDELADQLPVRQPHQRRSPE